MHSSSAFRLVYCFFPHDMFHTFDTLKEENITTMKKESAVFPTPFLCGILLGGILCVGAQTGTIYETYADVEYTVDRYDKGGSPTFEVSFTDNDITSNYKFNADGFVKTFKADSEKYTMTYKKNGKLKKLKRKSSRRQLEEEDAIDITLVDETAPVKLSVAGETVPAPVVRRRLFECDECLQTWDVVCGNGVDTVCRLDGYGSPILSAGKESISSYCHYFGSLCNERTSNDVCQDECDADYECLAPLTVKLEFEHTGVSESTSEEGVILDLYVIDPEGQTAYWENPSTVRECNLYPFGGVECHHQRRMHSALIPLPARF